MPQKDDFLTRLQEQLVLALEQAQELAQAGQLGDALSTLHAMQRRVVGLDSNLVQRLPSADLLLLLGPTGFPDLEKTLQCAELLRAEDELRRAQGEDNPALSAKALELYLHALEREPGFVTHYRDALESAAQALGGALSPALQERLLEVYNGAGAFADAENWLYRWQEGEPHAARVRAEAFYGDLLALSDETLTAGGLPRDEVEEGLATLRGARMSRPLLQRVTNRFASRRAQAMPVSVFDTMDRAKARAHERGLTIIDLSIGSSDLPPPEVALAALREATHQPETYGYCLHTGTGPLRRAVSAWTERRYGWTPDPEREVLPLIGSQEGFANLLLATTDPGDIILAPDPGYPSYYGAIALAGLDLHKMPLLEANGYLPDLGAIPAEVARRARVLLISYPNNPTAAVAPEAFFAEAVAFCRTHDILLVHDFPYVDMVFGGYRAPSVLTQPGARETAVELYSASKSFHMSGFRVGWAVGNRDALAALAKVKGAVDFNQYRGIQWAAVAALEHAEGETEKAARVLEARRDRLALALNVLGWPTPLPQASMYLWTRLPAGVTDSFAFVLALTEKTGVCLAPGRAFGEEGEGYVRFALVREPEVLEEAAARIQGFFRELEARRAAV